MKNLIVLFFTIQIIYINSQGTECPNDTPFKKSGSCINYCSYYEILSNKCEISNSLIKTQYLNEINQLGDTDFKHLSVIQNPDKDFLILETSYDRLDIYSKKRTFYGLKSNGDFYFSSNNPYYTLNMDESLDRGISEIISFKIGSKSNYVLNVGQLMEVYDFNYERGASFEKTSIIFNDDIFSERNVLMKTDDETELIYGYIADNKFFLTKFYLQSPSLTNSYYQDGKNSELAVFSTYIVSCFQTSNEIECLLRDQERKLIVAIYGNDLAYPKSIELNNNNNNYMVTSLFSKCIHLTGRVGAFVYYLDDDSSPKLDIKEYDGSNSLTNYISISFPIDINKNNKYLLFSDFNKNDLVKLNEKRFAFIAQTNEDNFSYNIILFIFTIYDTDVENAIYKIPFYNFYHLLPKDGLRGFSLNEMFGIGFTSENTTDNNIKTYFMLFSYPNSTDQYNSTRFIICSNNADEFIEIPASNLFKNFSITNNIFGLEIKEIEISDLPDSTTGLSFAKVASDDSASTLEKTNRLTKNDKIKITASKNLNEYYSIKYYGIASEPTDYAEYKSYSDEIYNGRENNYSPNKYKTRETNYQFRIIYVEEGAYSYGYCCHSKCINCDYLGSDNANMCTKCNDGTYFKASEYLYQYPLINNCYNFDSTTDKGYYLNKTSEPYLISECYDSCETCTQYGTKEWQNCLTCKTGSYKKEDEKDKSNNCYSVDEPGYFPDNTASPTLLLKCSEACTKCSAKPSSTSTNCIANSCNTQDSYYAYDEDRTNCVQEPAGYYLEVVDATHVWKKCSSKCASCVGPEETSTMNCIKCASKLILADGTASCYSSPPEHYFYNSDTGTFSECSENCLTCSGNKDNCLSFEGVSDVQNANGDINHN